MEQGLGEGVMTTGGRDRGRNGVLRGGNDVLRGGNGVLRGVRVTRGEMTGMNRSVGGGTVAFGITLIVGLTGFLSFGCPPRGGPPGLTGFPLFGCPPRGGPPGVTGFPSFGRPPRGGPAGPTGPTGPTGAMGRGVTTGGGAGLGRAGLLPPPPPPTCGLLAPGILPPATPVPPDGGALPFGGKCG